MDYTDASRMKALMGANSNASDTLLATIATAVSRAVDRYCTGAMQSDDYFKLETLSNETRYGRGRLCADGMLRVWPRKPVVSAVTALEWKYPTETTWQTLTPALLGPNSFGSALNLTGRAMGVDVRYSYTGGFGAALTTLPADLVDACTVLGVRFFKEAESGLSDSIGVAELGILVYTKAMPVRVIQMLQPYKRITPW